MFSRAKVREQARQVVFARDAATQENNEILAKLDELRAEIETDRASPGAVRAQLLQNLRAMQRQCLANTVLLQLPGLADLPKDAFQELQHSLQQLDDLLRGAAADAGTPYQLDNVVALLATQGRILEYSDHPSADGLARAAQGLAAMADTIVRAALPPADGSALTTLSGLDVRLDKILAQLQTQATASILKQFIATRDGCLVADLNPQQCQEARADAESLVNQTLQLARLKQRALRACEAAPPSRMVTGLQGVRVDAAFVAGLRATFGKDAEKTGLIVAALLVAERQACESPAAQHLRAGIEIQLQELSALQKRLDAEGTAQAEARLPEIRSLINSLNRRLRSLQPESEYCRSELLKAEDALRDVEDELEATRQDLASIRRDQATCRGNPIEPAGPAGLARDAAQPQIGDELQSEEKKPEEKLLEKEKQLTGSLGMAARALAYWRARTEAAAPPESARAEGSAGREGGGQGSSGAGAYTAATRHGGLTQHELEQLGLSNAEARAAVEAVARFVQRGLASASQVEAIVKDANRVIDRLGKPGIGTRSALSRLLPDHRTTLAATNAEARNRQFSDRFVRHLTRAQPPGTGLPTQIRNALLGTPESPGTLAALLPDTQPAEDDLRGLAQRYGDLERRLLELTDEVIECERLRAEAQEAIQTFDARRDPGRPHGLRVASQLLASVDLLQWTGDTAQVAPADQARFTTLCKALRGLDENTLTQSRALPWRTVRIPTLADIARIARNPRLMQAARGIVFLREDEARAHERVQREVVATVSEMEEVLDQRAVAMGRCRDWLRDVIRAAILQQLAATPGATLEHFIPAEHAEPIKATLREWCVPVDEALPEINRMLSQTFGVEEVDEWLRAVDLDAQAEIAGAATGGDADSRARLKRDLLAGIDRMSAGTKLKLTAGRRLDVQTGNIPLEPSATVNLNVKAGAGRLSGLEIERGSDGYSLVLRDGWDGKLGGELNAQVWAGALVGVKAQASAGAEGSAYRVTGVTLKFPPNEQGKAALQRFVGTLIVNGRVEPHDLSEAGDILPLIEYRLGKKGTLGAKLGFDPLGAATLPSADLKDDMGVGPLRMTLRGRAKANVAAAAVTDNHLAGNADLVIRKRDTTETVELSGALGVDFRTQDTAGKPAPYSISTDIAAVQTTALPFHIKVKAKEIRGADGLVASAEITRQCFAPPRRLRERALFDRVGGPAFRRLFATLTEAEQREIRRIIESADGRDLISIGFTLDESVRVAANELLQRAQALRAGRTAADTPAAAAKQAQELERKAEALLADQDNYIPSRLQLIPTLESAKTVPGLNLLFAIVSGYHDGKSEWVAVEMRFDAHKARSAARS